MLFFLFTEAYLRNSRILHHSLLYTIYDTKPTTLEIFVIHKL